MFRFSNSLEGGGLGEPWVLPGGGLGDKRSGSPYMLKCGATRRASNCSLVK